MSGIQQSKVDVAKEFADVRDLLKIEHDNRNEIDRRIEELKKRERRAEECLFSNMGRNFPLRTYDVGQGRTVVVRHFEPDDAPNYDVATLVENETED